MMMDDRCGYDECFFSVYVHHIRRALERHCQSSERTKWSSSSLRLLRPKPTSCGAVRCGAFLWLIVNVRRLCPCLPSSDDRGAQCRAKEEGGGLFPGFTLNPFSLRAWSVIPNAGHFVWPRTTWLCTRVSFHFIENVCVCVFSS